jgi:hypothetical protein
VFDACIRPVLLYGAEAWGVTQGLESVFVSCDRRILRHMVGVTWRDGVSSVEVAARCNVKELSVVLRERRLRWFGHVMRREGAGALGRIMEMEVEGRLPRGRPKKSWLKCIEEDLEKIGAVWEDAMD